MSGEVEMICILKVKRVDSFLAPSALLDIAGWIIATDVHDARHQAQMAFEADLAAELYRWEWPTPGKHQLTTGHIMLVS